MHLKSLTLRGFKSFASATTLRFEPGITAVVGPNGSGKSNVVDAIAWVLGEQGAKALRGGKMEDVIFAGTAGRPPLGRAEVTLTIDNSDSALPIDYTEVSITRRMFREGTSEYEINGERARLLDIQELLSDSGIGREMHVIVGQGQLDAVLQARPEDRRGFIEEAAGVLKHRKRKEKALRKLEAMQANLTRLTDLTAELRRQLKPLGKQAEIARRAAGVQAELRDSRLRLLADDLVTLRAELAARGRRRGGDPRPPRPRSRPRSTQARAPRGRARGRGSPRTRRWSRAPRRPGTGCPRSRSGSAAPRRWPPSGRGTWPPSPSERVPAATRRRWRPRPPRSAPRRSGCRRELGRGAGGARPSASPSARTLERRLADAERALVAAARAVADRREGLAKLAGQVNALRTRAAAAGDEIARLTAAADDARERAAAGRRPSWTGCRPRSARSTRASSASTSGTRTRSPALRGQSRPGSRELRRGRARGRARAVDLDRPRRRAGAAA